MKKKTTVRDNIGKLKNMDIALSNRAFRRLSHSLRNMISASLSIRHKQKQCISKLFLQLNKISFCFLN